MIIYDPGYWGIAFIFQRTGSIFPKAMAFAVPLALFSSALHYTLNHTEHGGQVSAALGLYDLDTDAFRAFNFVLGFLIVFRSQQAYSRWWEGGTLLQQLRGEWFNSFSCLVAFCNAHSDKREDVAKFQQQLVRLFSLLYGCALTQVSEMEVNFFELINLDGMGAESLKFLQTCPDKCEIALQWIQRLIVESEMNETLKIAPPILSRVYNELGNGIVNLNNARKIKEFPIPFALAQMIMVMLIFHAICTPLVCAATVKTTAWAGIITFVVTSCYWSLLYIALELEMPFGDDANDLPLKEMATDMNTSLLQLLKPFASAVPSFEYVHGTSLQAWSVDLDGDLSEQACTRCVEPGGGMDIEQRGSLPRKFNVGLKRTQTHEMNMLTRRAASTLADRNSRFSRHSRLSQVSNSESLGANHPDNREAHDLRRGVTAPPATSQAWSNEPGRPPDVKRRTLTAPGQFQPRYPGDPGHGLEHGHRRNSNESEEYAPQHRRITFSVPDHGGIRFGSTASTDSIGSMASVESDANRSSVSGSLYDPNGHRFSTDSRDSQASFGGDSQREPYVRSSQTSQDSQDSHMQTEEFSLQQNQRGEEYTRIIPGGHFAGVEVNAGRRVS